MSRLVEESAAGQRPVRVADLDPAVLVPVDEASLSRKRPLRGLVDAAPAGEILLEPKWVRGL